MYYTTLEYANFPQRSSVLAVIKQDDMQFNYFFDGIMEPSEENAENSEPTRPNVNNHTPEQKKFLMS